MVGLCYGDFSSICLMLSSRLYYRYFGLIFCAPAASFNYYHIGYIVLVFPLDLLHLWFWVNLLAACVGVVGPVCDFSSIFCINAEILLSWFYFIFFRLWGLWRVCSLYFVMSAIFFNPATDLSSRDFGALFFLFAMSHCCSHFSSIFLNLRWAFE